MASHAEHPNDKALLQEHGGLLTSSAACQLHTGGGNMVAAAQQLLLDALKESIAALLLCSRDCIPQVHPV